MRSTPAIPPPGYFETIRAACDKHRALLILDEIPNALGGTGKMFTCEHYNVVPDTLVIGKGLGGGIFPLAALIARQDLNVAPEQALGHYTHEKNPVACTAALATIESIEQDHLLGNAKKVGNCPRAHAGDDTETCPYRRCPGGWPSAGHGAGKRPRDT